MIFNPSIYIYSASQESQELLVDFATTAWSAVPLLDAARPRCRLRSSLSLSQSRRISTLNVSLPMLTTSWKNHCLNHVKYNLDIMWMINTMQS
jgi:hypothetical protein